MQPMTNSPIVSVPVRPILSPDHYKLWNIQRLLYLGGGQRIEIGISREPTILGESKSRNLDVTYRRHSVQGLPWEGQTGRIMGVRVK